jgi:uncharacterized protein
MKERPATQLSRRPGAQVVVSSLETQLRRRLEALRVAGQVRLDEEESAALAYALAEIPAGEVALFGSRVDTARRGGDIDLLILADAPAFETAQQISTRFFARCEEKIDVVVMNPTSMTREQSDFLARIKRMPLTTL